MTKYLPIIVTVIIIALGMWDLERRVHNLEKKVDKNDKHDHDDENDKI